MVGYIYVITNMINGKKYVGQHKSKQIDSWYKGSGVALWAAYKKYGIDNFKMDILEECFSLEELNHKETDWIKRLNTFSRNGYNLTFGGEGKKGVIVTEETRIKMSRSLKGKRKGIKFTEEHRKRMGESRKGRVTSNETKKKISESQKERLLNNPQKHTEETKRKIREGNLGKNKNKIACNRRPCKLIFLNGEEVKFDYVGQAYEYFVKNLGLYVGLAKYLLSSGKPLEKVKKKNEKYIGIRLIYLDTANDE